MAYSPTTWVDNETIVSAARLNNIEQGIVAQESSVGVLQPSASNSDVGKFLKVKTVTSGKVSEYEFGAASGGGASISVSGTTLAITT